LRLAIPNPAGKCKPVFCLNPFDFGSHCPLTSLTSFDEQFRFHVQTEFSNLGDASPHKNCYRLTNYGQGRDARKGHRRAQAERD